MIGEVRRDGIAEVVNIGTISSSAVVHFINKSIIAINIPLLKAAMNIILEKA